MGTGSNGMTRTRQARAERRAERARGGTTGVGGGKGRTAACPADGAREMWDRGPHCTPAAPAVTEQAPEHGMFAWKPTVAALAHHDAGPGRWGDEDLTAA